MNSPVDGVGRLSQEDLRLPAPVIAIAESSSEHKGGIRRVMDLFAGGMFVRYLLVGLFNTLIGYCSFVIVLHLLSKVIATQHLYLAAPLASVISTPVNITIAYFGYKFLVFRTRGNYLMEWLKCFAVYGTGMLPGLFALGALTRLFQGLIHTHAAMLHAALGTVEAHLSGPLLHGVQTMAASKNMAGNLAGAIVMGLTTIYSFIGHRKVTFKPVADKS
jgi:putative flippase GtrA